jgi:hypothetical protein
LIYWYKTWHSLQPQWLIQEKKKSILKLPTKEWHDKSDHSQRPPSWPPKRQGSGQSILATKVQARMKHFLIGRCPSHLMNHWVWTSFTTNFVKPVSWLALLADF